MRSAYVGLSGPLIYDYGHQASQGPADLSSSPNPILDSPFGLLLLYDEIWFLTRSLCPGNMRELDYVRFLDEEGRIPQLSEVEIAQKAKQVYEDDQNGERYDRVTRLFRDWDMVLERMAVDWEHAVDNHTHSLQIGEIRVSANSLRLESVLFDLALVERLGDKRIDVIANSFGQRWVETATPGVREADLAHVLVLDRIPNYVGPQGPYHPVIEEARDNKYLKDFRKWITDTSASTDEKEVAEVKESVEAALQETRDQIFLRYLEDNRLYNSLGKTLVAEGANLVVPLVGTGATVIQDIREARKATEIRWQGFLVELARKTRD